MTDLEQIRQKTWRAIKTAMGTDFVVGIVAALLAPDALIKALPGYEAFARTVDTVVPGVGHLAVSSPEMWTPEK